MIKEHDIEFEDSLKDLEDEQIADGICEALDIEKPAKKPAKKGK